MPGIVDKVAEYCWSNNFLDIFRNYFRDHGADFIDAPEMNTGEHNLHYYSLFQEYLKIYEDALTDYVSKLGYDISDFYSEVRDIQTDQNTDERMKLFIDCLLASMDYDSFYKVMLREGKKLRGPDWKNPNAVCSPCSDSKSAGNANESPSKSTGSTACRERAPDSKETHDSKESSDEKDYRK